MLLTAIYLVMPVGRLSWRHALIGGTAAAILWEITRHVLVWYYSTISQIQVVYGSLTTSIAVLLSVEIGAIVLLLGAQVIAEYERIGYEPIDNQSETDAGGKSLSYAALPRLDRLHVAPLAPTNSCRGRPILYSGSAIISFSCAIQPTVRASAKTAVNSGTGMPIAFCTMPE